MNLSAKLKNDLTWQFFGQGSAAAIVATTTIYLNSALNQGEFSTFVVLVQAVTLLSLAWTGIGALNTASLGAENFRFVLVTKRIKASVIQAILITTLLTAFFGATNDSGSASTLEIMLFAVLCCPTLVAVDLVNQFLVARGELKIVGIMPLLNSAAQLFLILILFGFFAPSIENAAFAFLGGSFVTAIVLAFQFNRFDTEQEKTSVKAERLWLHNTRIAYGLSLMILVGSLAMKSDVFTVYYLLGAEESSSYSLASRFREMLMIAGGIFTFVWQPRAVINTRNDSHENNSRVVWYAVFGTALLSILAVFLIALLGVFNAIQEYVETMILFALFIPGVCVAVAFSMTRATDIARAKWRDLAKASFFYFFCSFACVYVGAISQGAIGAAGGFSAGGIAFVAIYFGMKNLSWRDTTIKQH